MREPFWIFNTGQKNTARYKDMKQHGTPESMGRTLLTLTFEDSRNNHRARDAEEKAAEDIRLSSVHIVRVENVTSATVTEDCVPCWRNTATQAVNKDSEDTVSVLAWSLSKTSDSCSADSTISGALGQQRGQGRGQVPGESQHRDPFVQAPLTPSTHLHHSKTGPKKIDFALTVAPAEGTVLHTAIKAVLEPLRETSLTTSINPSSYTPLNGAPTTRVIKSKTSLSAEDPVLQLGVMACAIHRRLHTLPVKMAQGTLITETAALVTYPMIAIIDHQWEMYFACDCGKKILCSDPFFSFRLSN